VLQFLCVFTWHYFVPGSRLIPTNERWRATSTTCPRTTHSTLKTRIGMITLLLKHRREQKKRKKEREPKERKKTTIRSCIWKWQHSAEKPWLVTKATATAAARTFFTRTHAHTHTNKTEMKMLRKREPTTPTSLTNCANAWEETKRQKESK